MASLAPFTPGALISNGEPVDATVTNRPIQPLINRMYEVVNYQEVVVTSNYTVQSNQDVMIYVNNTTPVTITLPLAENQFIHKRIRIRKVSYNTQTVTVQCASGNTIEDRFRPTTNPTNTTLPLVVPGDEIELEPQGTIWRVNQINLPIQYCSVDLFSDNPQSIGTTMTNLIMENNSNNFNPLGLWNYTTNKFTAIYSGFYSITCAIYVASGANYYGAIYMGNPVLTTNFETGASGGSRIMLTTSVYLTVGRELYILIKTEGGTGTYGTRHVNINYLG